jgi:hypothetical protein
MRMRHVKLRPAEALDEVVLGDPIAASGDGAGWVGRTGPRLDPEVLRRFTAHRVTSASGQIACPR